MQILNNESYILYNFHLKQILFISVLTIFILVKIISSECCMLLFTLIIYCFSLKLSEIKYFSNLSPLPVIHKIYYFIIFRNIEQCIKVINNFRVLNYELFLIVFIT